MVNGPDTEVLEVPADGLFVTPTSGRYSSSNKDIQDRQDEIQFVGKNRIRYVSPRRGDMFLAPGANPG